MSQSRLISGFGNSLLPSSQFFQIGNASVIVFRDRNGVYYATDKAGITGLIGNIIASGTNALGVVNNAVTAINTAGGGILWIKKASYGNISPTIPANVFLIMEPGTTGITPTLQSGSGALALTSSGNVGIRTTSPSSFTLQVAGSIGPDSNNIYDLGSSALRWSNVWATNINTTLINARNLWHIEGVLV